MDYIFLIQLLCRGRGTGAVTAEIDFDKNSSVEVHQIYFLRHNFELFTTFFFSFQIQKKNKKKQKQKQKTKSMRGFYVKQFCRYLQFNKVFWILSDSNGLFFSFSSCSDALVFDLNDINSELLSACTLVSKISEFKFGQNCRNIICNTHQERSDKKETKYLIHAAIV